MNRSLITSALIILAIVLKGPIISFAQQSYIEDFTTTAFKDAINTTADWNTTDGELKLFPFAPSIVGSYDMPSSRAYDIVVAGDHAFVAGFSSLQVIDITDPTNPEFAGSYGTVGNFSGIAVSGNIAFVADLGSGVQLIDITDPRNPTFLGNYNTPSTAWDVAVAGDLAFVADDFYGLQVVDITDPANPNQRGSYDTPDAAKGVAVAGDLAFVADNGSGLQVIDITNPATPTFVGSVDTPGYAQDVAVSGDHAFVADGDSGLRVIDISNPASPTLVGGYDTPGWAEGVSVSGDLVCIADHAFGLHMIDISDPTSPTLAWSVDTPDLAYGVAVSGTHAFVADKSAGLQVIKIAEKVNPTPVGAFHIPFDSQGIAVTGDLALVANTYTGLHVIDITDPANPAALGNYDTPGYAWDVAVSGDLVILGDYQLGLYVIDIKDPADPTLSGSYDTPGFIQGVAVCGDLAFAADGPTGLQLIDITDPTNPFPVGSYDTPYYASSVAVSGDLALVTDGTAGLQLIDITDPANPILAGSFDTPDYAQDVAVSGNMALVADHSSGLLLIEISDPQNPTLVGSYDTPGWAWGVAVSGNLCFVADGGIVHVIDITDPANPTLGGSYDTRGYSYRVALAGDIAFVVMSHGAGLEMIQVFESEFGLDNDVGWSLPVDTATDKILSARLTTVQTDSVSWELSADGGMNWTRFSPDGPWAPFTFPGDDLLWRSKHTWAGENPLVSDLSIEWLTESARLESITDIPNDQGRQVRLEWSRSGHDFMGDVSQIVEYAVYRRIDEDLMVKPQTSQASDFDGCSLIAQEHAQMMQAAGWHFITTVPVRVEDHYAAVVPTLADSTVSAGLIFSTFMVSALTATPGVFYDSPPDSGYSVDNLAPEVPTAIIAAYQADSVTLDWDDAPETDFKLYRIYRSTDGGFTPSSDNFIHETATSVWIDPAANLWGYHYKITVIDQAGNESEAGSPESVSGVSGGTVPARTALVGAVPNPFNPSTKLSFEIAAPGYARLKVYDAAGRLVATLVDGHRDVGRHEVVWDGRDSTGRMSSAGVYLYRLETEGFSVTKRMTLVK